MKRYFCDSCGDEMESGKGKAVRLENRNSNYMCSRCFEELSSVLEHQLWKSSTENAEAKGM